MLSSSARGGATKAGKYGELLSILLTKSWPKENSGTDSFGLDKRIVEFLLTWNPMAGYLKFFGIKICVEDVMLSMSDAEFFCKWKLRYPMFLQEMVLKEVQF